MNRAASSFYFAYGSNMLAPRLAARTPSARVLGTARLASHRLTFHKHGMDGSAKCHAAPGDSDKSAIIGVLFEIARREEGALDRAEGLGRGYAKHTVRVQTSRGEAVEAMTYIGTALEPNLRPFHWYKAYVLAGARHAGLPADYVSGIEAVKSIEDPDGERAERHFRALAAAGFSIDCC